MNILSPLISDLVSDKHAYRQLLKVMDFKNLVEDLKDCYSELGRRGYPVESGFKALLLQYIEDLSDRELERFLQENLAGKMFCGFELHDATPDFSYFSVLRRRIGTERLSDLFNKIRAGMKKRGVIREVFSFVDASSMVSKLSTWEERDKAIKAGQERFDNMVAEKFASDKDAKFGCKGKNKYWFGYKRHVSVDMTNGLINRVDVTSAEKPDGDCLEMVCPDGGMVFADKGYCGEKVAKVLAKKNCHSGVIKRNNMKGKDFKHDKWLTGVRMPYEGVFSKMRKKTRYRGLIKQKWQVLFEAIAHNAKRLIRIGSPPLEYTS